jgi:hypothetical protein
MDRAERHQAGPLLARGELVTVDGHPVCAACGAAVAPHDDGQWEHVPEGTPFPRRSRWFSPVSWSELRGMRGYRDFTRRYPWTVRPELCGGAVTTEADWAEGTRRLRDYHGQLTAIRRRRTPPPGENPYLDLVHVLAGSRTAWDLTGGLRTMLDLPARRQELAAIFAWAIPGQAALSALARHAPLLECGAGTGYWAALLSQRHVDVLATGPPGRASHPGWPAHRPWTEVLPADAASAVRGAPDRVLLLSWPPPDDDGAGYAALRAYRGDVLAYIGDAPGPDGTGGLAGTIRLHRELALNWAPVEQVAIPNWPGLRDRLVVYRRNASRRPLAHRDRCPECGRYLPTGATGRCDRCFTRHPPAMAVQVNGHRVEYPQDIVDAMPEGLRRALARSPSLLWPPGGQQPSGPTGRRPAGA